MHASKLNQEATVQFSQSYAKIILDEFFNSNTFITGQQIISLSPIKQVNFFVLKVLFDQWQNEIKQLESPYFNYKNDEVNGVIKTLANTLSKHIQVGKEDLLPLVETAVQSCIELLYSPADFYLKEVKLFPQKEITKDLKSAGKYFKIHKRLFDELIKNIETSASGDFTIIENVIKNTVEKFEADGVEKREIEALFSSELEFKVLESDVVKPVEIVEPTPVVQPMEEDMSFFDNLEEEDISEPRRVEIPDVEVPKTTEPKPAPVSHVKESKEEIVEAPKSAPQETKIPEVKNLNEQFSEGDIKTLNDKYEEGEKPETIASRHEQKPTSELASSININQRYMFVNDLFEGNESDFERALEEIEGSKSFDSSVELLVQNYSRKYAWDMNSDEVKELLKVIFKRFR